MRSVSAVFLPLLAVCLAVGCGPSGPSKAKVHGKVTLDGKPMAEGKIMFFASDQTMSELPIVDGAYSGDAKSGHNAVQLGVYKTVKAPNEMPGMEPPKTNTLPAKYHKESKLTTELKSGDDNEYNVDATSK